MKDKNKHKNAKKHNKHTHTKNPKITENPLSTLILWGD